MSRWVVAVDVDGTLYDGDRVPPVAMDALQRARAGGHEVVIVTGRRWESLIEIVPDVVALAIGAVCEEGYVLVGRDGRPEPMAARVDPAMVTALAEAGVAPLDVGHVVVGTPAAARTAVERVLHDGWPGRHLVENKTSLAIAPGGMDKGAGLRRAARDLGLASRPVIAIGDAANDLPMFAIAAVAMGVANADDRVRAAGIALTPSPGGAGVAEALERWGLLSG